MYSCYQFVNLEVNEMRRYVFLGALVFSLATPAFAQEAQPAHRMGLSEVVAEALRSNPDVRIAAEEERSASGDRLGAAGHFGPLIHMDGNLQEWNSPYIIQFSFGGQSGPFPVRDQLTWTSSLSAIQPLTGLLAIFEQYHVADLGVDVARVRRDGARRDTGYRAIEGYYRLLEAERLADVASQSVDQLTSQLKQANSFHDAGTVSRDQVLRAELALASAKQRLIQQRAQVSLARSRLAVVMGMPASKATSTPSRSITSQRFARRRRSSARSKPRSPSAPKCAGSTRMPSLQSKGNDASRLVQDDAAASISSGLPARATGSGLAVRARKRESSSAERSRGISGIGARRSAASTPRKRSCDNRISRAKKSKTP